MGPISLTGIVIGAAYGYIAQRGAFCMNSGFRSVVTDGDTAKLKAYAIAIAVQLMVVPAMFAIGLPQPIYPSFFPLAAIIGGVLFGASMASAGGCAAGLWFKAGAGNASMLVAIVGMAIGAILLEIGPLSTLRSMLQGIGGSVRAVQLAPALGIPLWTIALPLGGAIFVWLLRGAQQQVGDWPWRKTGILMGLVGAAAWPLSSWGSRPFGMAVLPGTMALVTGGAGKATLPGWDMLYVIAIPLGALIAARQQGTMKPTLPSARELIPRFAGGLGLGVGASLAAGCTVGHGLTGIPLLAPGSIVTTIAIFGGSALTAVLQRRIAGTETTS